MASVARGTALALVVSMLCLLRGESKILAVQFFTFSVHLVSLASKKLTRFKSINKLNVISWTSHSSAL
jgi:hypothetical protein